MARNSIHFLPALSLFFAFAMLPAVPAFAHDDPENELVVLSQRIESEPGSAALRLERAELNRARRDWPAALADLQAASTLDPSMAAVDIALARLMYDSGDLPAARDAADRFVSRSPRNVTGHLVRARILLKTGDRAGAAAAFTRAIEIDRERRGDASAIQPDDYLDRARALDDIGHTDEAVEGLDEGIASLGGAVTLQLLAIELDQKRGHTEGALARVARLEAAANRKESWMARRGDILAAAGRREDAQAAYRGALDAISALPARARDNGATVDLEASVRRKLAETADAQKEASDAR